MSKETGDVLQGKHWQHNMDSPAACEPPIRSIGQHRTIGCIWKTTIRIWKSSRYQTQLTQKQLATFRRDNTTVEAVLSQQRHDRETKAALKVMEGGRSHKSADVRSHGPSGEHPPDRALSKRQQHESD